MSFARQSIAITLMLGGAAQAADPPASPPAEKPADKPVHAATPASKRAPLDLRIGDVRRYMLPSEYLAAIQAPDAERDTVVVEGERPAPPLKSSQPIPGGIATPFWMLAHPLKAWRALLPDPNAPPPGPPDVVPQREFRWGP